ncbi:MAG: cytochrome b N-terminal domain-containing protein [Deltaproteobacteria bacterium]|nr:cytochrome b N-terminal domain-containing protein [Deltaproteobacteria bacterium]
MYQTALAYGRKGVLAIEGWADRIFTPRYNPFYYLGAIAIFFLWLLLISGVYLFIFYEIGAPYESLKYITEKQWYLGGIMRSIHRYAADGMVIASILHLLHVYLTDRYRRWRWVAWVSGIVLLGAVWITGVVGYWMVWDERSQIIADLTAGLLDYIPIFGDSLSMSFTSNNLITNLFFFVALFIHIMVPVLLFVIHKQQPYYKPLFLCSAFYPHYGACAFVYCLMDSCRKNIQACYKSAQVNCHNYCVYNHGACCYKTCSQLTAGKYK